MKKQDLCERLFQFSVRVIKYLRNLPRNTEYKVVRYQLVKCSTSSGANYEEAQAGSSRADFVNKIRITLREMRESNYWLRILNDILPDKYSIDELKYLLQESKELMNILGSIIIKTQKIALKD